MQQPALPRRRLHKCTMLRGANYYPMPNHHIDGYNHHSLPNHDPVPNHDTMPNNVFRSSGAMHNCDVNNEALL